MEIVKTIIDQYVLNPEFLKVMGMTWLLLKALQQIKAIADWENQYKQLASLIIGTLLGYVVIEASVAGLIAGFFAGGAITLTVMEYKEQAMIAGGKAKLPPMKATKGECKCSKKG